MIKNEAVLILDFGGQYSQLIARRVRDCNVFCEIKPYNISAEEIQKNGYKGIIFSGGPNSVYAENAPKCDTNLFHLGIPVLGICYGAQLIAATLGGTVDNSEVKEYGNTEVTYHCDSVLFQDIDKTSIAWMSHTDYISALPAGFTATATTSHCPVAAMEHSEKKIFALQFHPEVEHSVAGNQILKNFLYHVCDCKGDWEMASFAKMSIESLKEQIGDKKVLCALSGGVDSSVAALLVHKAIGKNLTCIFVDHGLLRKNEGDEVEEVFRKCYSTDPESPRAKVNCYGANDVTEGVAIMWKEGVDVSITGNSTNPTRFQHPVAGTYKKECVEKGKKYFSVASGGGTGRTLHPDNMAAGPASYGMTDTMGRMHSDAQFAGSSSVPAHVEMMGLIGMGNNPMVGATVAVAVSVQQAADEGKF